MSFFGLGKLVYVIILITNSIAILSEDRFLARIGWGRTQADPAFGAAYDSTSVKAKTINLIASVRTVMRSTYSIKYPSA
ncbi:Yos1-like protein [Aspergillus unguis]